MKRLVSKKADYFKMFLFKLKDLPIKPTFKLREKNNKFTSKFNAGIEKQIINQLNKETTGFYLSMNKEIKIFEISRKIGNKIFNNKSIKDLEILKQSFTIVAPGIAKDKYKFFLIKFYQAIPLYNII